jgi:hypothetical protein
MQGGLKHIKKWCYALLLASPWGLLAQVDFTASVKSTTVAEGERFTVEFDVNVRGENFKPPSFSGFQVLSGPNTSMSTYMDNTGTRFQMGYGYTLKARSQGSYTIGPAFIQYKGKTYKTKPLNIRVSEKKAPAPNSPEAKARKNVFFRPLVNRSKVYLGEPLFARYKLYFRNDISAPQLTGEPDFNGFYKEEIEQKRVDTKSEIIDGQRFTTGDIRQMVLIPQKAGTQKLGAVQMTVRTTVPNGRYDIFGRPMGRSMELDLEENFPTIEVKPLPLSGKPQNFSGAVGDYTFNAKLSQNSITTDESVTLTLELKGTGNIKLATLPEVEFPAAFEVFDPERKERASVGSYGMRGSKKVEYLLVPRYSGTYKIGPIRFSYFNPQTERYQTISSPQFEITVTGGQAPPPGLGKGGVSATEKESVKFIGKDILFIKTQSPRWQSTQGQFLGSTLFYALLAGIAALIVALLGYYKISAKNNQNVGLRRQQKAGKLARKHLGAAKKALKTQNADAFYQALTTALYGYFGNKLNMPPSQLSKENIAQNLSQAGLSQALIEQTTALLNNAEMARYTGAGGQNLKEDYKQTADLLNQIEKQL